MNTDSIPKKTEGQSASSSTTTQDANENATTANATTIPVESLASMLQEEPSLGSLESFGSANPWNVSPAVTSSRSGDGSSTNYNNNSTQAQALEADIQNKLSQLEEPADAQKESPTSALNSGTNNGASIENPLHSTNSSMQSEFPTNPPPQQQLQQQHQIPQQSQPLPGSLGGATSPASGTSSTFDISTLAGLQPPTASPPNPASVADGSSLQQLQQQEYQTIPQQSPSSASEPQLTENTAPTPASNNESPSSSTRKQLTVDTTTGTNNTNTTAAPHPTAKTGDDTSSSHNSVEGGGRLWQAALHEANNTPSVAQSKSSSRFAESIMERTRSRADPNALVSPSNTQGGMSSLGGKMSMITVGGDESSYILSSALAKKRVRVVQLLLIGLLGLLLGLLGNFFVSSSCHFGTVQIAVGQQQNEFDFHFGLWKYSPIDSVFQGYPYCFKYDQNYAAEAPVMARVANITALITGLIALSILWLYLIFGYADKTRWKWAVRIAVLAGLIQLGTLLFFVGTLCQEYTCQLGPGAYLAIFTSLVWFVVACEMQYHMPVASYASYTSPDDHEPAALVTTMEMTHLDDVTREYITRVTGKKKEDEMPTLQTNWKGARPRSGVFTPTSTNGGSLYLPSPRGTYRAPDPDLVEKAFNFNNR